MSAEPLGKKGHSRALRAHRTRNRPFRATLVAPWARTGVEPVNPCWGRSFGLQGELGSESQNGNPGLYPFKSQPFLALTGFTTPAIALVRTARGCNGPYSSPTTRVTWTSLIRSRASEGRKKAINDSPIGWANQAVLKITSRREEDS